MGVATIIFSKPVAFPIAPLRDMLTTKLPRYRWQCGEADTGAPKQMGSFADKPLICGRSDETVVFVETRPTLGTLAAPAPPHAWWLHVGRPTTELEPIADRVTLVICIVSMILDEDDARCQLVEGGPWLTGQELVEVLKAVEVGQPLALAAGIARPPATFTGRPAAAELTAPAPDGRYADLPPERAAMLASMDESLARILHEKGMGSIAVELGMAAPPAYAHETPRDDALPTLVLLSTAPLFVDWRKIEEGLGAIDREAGWSVEPAGPHTGTLRGRGAAITLSSGPTPLPPYLLAQGMAREHFLRPEQRALLTSHRCRQAITVALDTRQTDFVDVRQAAKAAAMLMAPLAIHPGCVGLFNAGTGVATPVDRVRDAIGALAQDEVPIAIWTWTAVDSAVTDAVSLSTAGLRPFVGFEVECWNAPGDLTSVAERLNGVMRYLLINGPVIKHGDTIGDTAGDRSTRCFLGHSKAQRGEGEPVPAMLLEFDGRGGCEPKPDLPDGPAPESDPIRAALATFKATGSIDAAARAAACAPLRRVGGFGRKGL